MLQERAEAGAGEVMTQELSLGNLELTFAQANRQAVDSAFSMAENLALGSANFSGSSLGGLAYTGGPGLVSRSWRTPWLGLEVVNPSEERTSGNSESNFWIH